MTLKKFKNEKNRDPEMKKAEALLLTILRAKSAQDQVQSEFAAEIEAVKTRFAGRVQRCAEAVNKAENELIDLMKSNKAAWFGTTDQVNLEHGILLHGSQKKVKIPRDALERLEELGWFEAVKTVKSVDREVVEGMPDEKLVQIGAERKIRETFTYEIKGSKGKEGKDGNQKRR